MELDKVITCHRCKNKNFTVKREVTYVYTYKIDTDNIDSYTRRTKNYPFLFDNREKVESEEYAICDNCGERYPIELDENKDKIDFTILRKAVRADIKDTPQFLG